MNGRVLVVDDDPVILRTMKASLHEVCTVTLVNSGATAFRALEKVGADLILLDLWMPEMNGLQTLVRLRNNPAYAEIPVVILSGDDDENTVRRCYELGAQVFLKKPASTAELLSTVQRFLPNAQAT